ncbi:MAG TPA: hypothetical protein VK094_00265 [Pseudogracilibacillus sp.]|nr:hypothetical protein [Pseudogracilibacillus sp.]
MNGFELYKLEQAFEGMKVIIKPLVEQQKSYYDECIKQGFSEEESLKSSIGYINLIMEMSKKDD